MKMMVDLRWVRSQTLDGIGRYTLSVMAEILRIRNHHRWIFLVENEDMQAFCQEWWQQYAPVALVAEYDFLITHIPATSFKNRYLMPRWIKKERPDLFYSPYYIFIDWKHPCIRVMTVHDLIPLRFPELFKQASWPFRLLMTRPRPLQKRLQTAAAIVTVSRSTSRDLQQLLHIKARKITVIYPGVNMNPSALDTTTVLAHYQVPDKPFILCVSRAEPYKNLELLLQIYRDLEPELRQNHPLVLICPHHEMQTPKLQALIQEYQLQQQVYLIGAVTTAELPIFYQRCMALVLLSLYEGFGLPVLEAMAYGAPVMVSDTASLPEVVGDAGLLVNPHEPGQIRAQLHELLTNQGLQKRLSMAGLIRASQFKWEHTAQELLSLFERLLDEQLKSD